MVSKNNAQMKDRYAIKQMPHYGIRKLSIGVASVLLSTTLYMGVTAHADTVNRVADDVTQPVTSNNSSEHQGTLTIGDASTDKDTKTPASEVTSTAIAEASFVSTPPSDSSASQGSVATDVGASSTAVNTAADSAPTTPVMDKASHESNSQVQPSSLTDTIQTKLVRRPFMRLAAVSATDSDELIVGKDVTISNFSVTAAEGKNEFENAHANIKFTMHADDPSALAGKRLTIQLDGNVWGHIDYDEIRRVNPTTISYQGQVIGTLDYSFSSYFACITFNDRVKDYTKINVQLALVVSGIYQNTLPYNTDVYTPTQAKDGQIYHLTNDVTIGQQNYSSNLPSTIHYHKLRSESVSSVISLTTTSYSQRDSELYAGTFYKTPNGIYYSQSSYYSGNNLYSEQSGQSGYLEGPSLNVGNDIITDHTRSYTATFDIDYTKLFPDSNLKLKPVNSYLLFKDYFDDQDLLPGTSDVYIEHSSTVSSTDTADATVSKNSVIFNRLNGQSLATQNIYIKDNWNNRTSNYIDYNGKLHFTPALFKQLQAAAENDQNLTKAINTIKATGMATKIKLVNPINTGLKATIKTSDGKTKETPLPIDTIDYQIVTASTAPKGAILVAAQGKTVKVYHPGDQNIPAVVDQSQLTKTITRTINVHEPGKSVTTTKQTVTLTQSVSVADGKDVTYNGDWKVQGDSQWASYDVPNVPGYTASQSRVAQQEVSDTTQDQTIEITYTANEHQISVEYVDNATGHVVKTDHLSGKTGQTVSITPHVPDGWELVSGQTVPSEVTLDADGAPTTVIKVQPQERSVAIKFVDDQSYDFDTSDHKKQVGQAITVTGRDGDTVKVNVTVPDKYQLAKGQQLPTTYTFAKGSGDLKIHLVHKVVQLKATVDVKLDLLTAVSIYSNHETPLITVTQDQWKQIEAESKYVDFPDELTPSVKAGTLTGHVDYDLVYGNVVSFGDDWTSLNLGGQTYQLPNGDELVNGVMALSDDYPWGKTLKEFFLKDNTNTDSDYANRPWHGYLSVNTTNNNEDIRRTGLQAGLVGDEFNALAKATGDRAATGIEMANKTINLSWLQDHVGLSLPEINEQDGQVKYHTSLDAGGVYIPYVEKTVTRTINVKTPDGKTTTVKQTATLAKQVDLGKDAHPAWTTGEWVSYDVPTIPGYTASQNEVPATEVTSDMTDQTVDISYTANSQTIHINYVDDHTGKIVHTAVVTGKTGETVNLNLTVPDKYQLADGQQLPTTYTFTAGSGDVTIHLAHKVVQREATIDVQIGLMTLVTFSDDEDEPSIVVTQNQWRQLDDEIKKHALVNDFEKVVPTVEVGTLTGHVNYDLVDNKVVSFGNDWTSLNLGGQTYQMPDGTEVVNGVMLNNSIVWGKKLKEQFLKYYPDDPDYVTRPWHGYLSVNKSRIPSDLLVGNESNALAKATDDRAATAIEMPNKPIDLSLLQDLSDFNEQDGQLRAKAIVLIDGMMYIPYVEKTATRTINVTTPDGKTTSVKQTITLAKRIDFNEDDHPDWTTGEWTRYDVPTIPGYTASQSQVAKETVTGTTKDQTINITYTANPQTTHINYVDAQGKLVHTTTVNGQTDQTVDVPSEVPDGWMLYSGQNIPKSITFQAANNDRDYVVKHVQSFVLSTAPKEAGTIIEGTKSKTYPAGVSDADLNKTVTRTILVKDANGRTVNTKTQTVHFVRNAVVDAVTGHVDYLDWSEDGSHIFAAYTPVPKNGYTINSAKMATITPKDTDSTIELTYKPIPKTIKVEYMTTDGKQIASQNVKADDNNQVKFVAPDGYVLATNTNTVNVSDLNDNIYRVLVRANEQTYTAGSTNIPKNVKNLTKVVTRTIMIVMPNGHKRTIKQQVTFERTATVKSDGSVVYTDYQPVGHDTFNHIFIAHRFGYNLNFSDGSKSVTRIDHVTADTPDQTIVVTYVRKNAN